MCVSVSVSSTCAICGYKRLQMLVVAVDNKHKNVYWGGMEYQIHEKFWKFLVWFRYCFACLWLFSRKMDKKNSLNEMN